MLNRSGQSRVLFGQRVTTYVRTKVRLFFKRKRSGKEEEEDGVGEGYNISSRR